MAAPSKLKISTFLNKSGKNLEKFVKYLVFKFFLGKDEILTEKYVEIFEK